MGKLKNKTKGKEWILVLQIKPTSSTLTINSNKKLL